ncbi:MAG: prepilin-type N-terminal cleavage/methylation domain-containing protein [Phycisphaera sp.]|nr:prepilin-type N-terminal cleavage/methylation domain-containing protein [Phycisphaera sp.]
MAKGARRAGFTLIELLVVVSIIALLIAILLPSLKNARESAKATVCLAQLHELGHTVHMYANEYNGRMFPYFKKGGVSSGGLTYANFWMTLLEKYHGYEDAVRVCPSAPVNPEGRWNYTTGAPDSTSVWGSVNAAWGKETGAGGFLGKHVGSYTWNAWMHGGRNYDISLSPLTNGIDDHRHWKQLSSIKAAYEVPMFADGVWVDTWFQNRSGSWSAVPPTLQGWNSAAGRVCIDRHKMAINIAFADGGGRRVDLQDLWRQRWNTESEPMDPPTPLPAE